LRPSRLARLAAAAAVLSVWSALAEPKPVRKQLLEWGWAQPDTASLRAHLAQMERAPFDGCVFGVGYGPAGQAGSFTWQAWGRRRFSREELASAEQDLRALRPRRFRSLLLRLNVTPGDVGWFQDHTAILANAELAASLARAGHARGVLLDVEQYQGPLFDFHRQPMAAAYGWEACARQVRRRGREVMEAFQKGYPGLTVFLTFGHTLPWLQMTAKGDPPSGGSDLPAPPGARRPLADVPYGLLAPFVDGLLDGARGRTVVVDGFELSYGFREPSRFEEARRTFDTGVLPIVADRAAYRRHARLAFGLWLDYDWRRLGWFPGEPSRNHFTPDALATALHAARGATDEFVWLYSEKAPWWSTTSPPPLAYQRVVQGFETHRGVFRSPEP
jgi:hypothetical protein